MKWREIETGFDGRLQELRNKTAYEVLEIDASSSLLEAKKAWRRKVALYHPDRVDPFMRQYAQELVKILNEAWEFIERQQSDRAGSDEN